MKKSSLLLMSSLILATMEPPIRRQRREEDFVDPSNFPNQLRRETVGLREEVVEHYRQKHRRQARPCFSDAELDHLRSLPKKEREREVARLRVKYAKENET